MDADIIIAGAGAAGLYAAYLLSEAGKKVMVIEARDRCGGRILTIQNQQNPYHFETGAEFIHGSAPITNSLIKLAGLNAVPAAGAMIKNMDGRFIIDKRFIENEEKFTKALEEVETEMPVTAFLESRFPGIEHKELKDSVLQYLWGYDAALPEIASTLALKSEWLDENGDRQFRISEGYSKLIDFLYSACIKKDCRFLFSSEITSIQWKPKEVIISCLDKKYTTPAAVIAIPLNLFTELPAEGRFTIYPLPVNFSASVKKLGFGDVIKILIGFKTKFWEDKPQPEFSQDLLNKTSFIFSNQEIPTWWTQYPDDKPLLTGWIAGPQASILSQLPDESILEKSLQSLTAIFNMHTDELKEQIVTTYVSNWKKDPHSSSAYSFLTVSSREAQQYFTNCFNNTLYFAGEALCNEGEVGTVEAAFKSAGSIVSLLLDQ